MTDDGRGYFERHDRFTTTEFVTFLENACKKLGKILMILDRAPQHRAKAVRDLRKKLGDKIRLSYQPPGCPDLNSNEEVWRQMKMHVLSGPYIKFDKMCADIDDWLEHHLPSLDIYKYLYRSV